MSHGISLVLLTGAASYNHGVPHTDKHRIPFSARHWLPLLVKPFLS